MKRFISLIIAATLFLTLSLALASCGINSSKDLENITDDGVLKVGMECNYAPFNWTQTEKSDTAVKLSSGGYADGYDVQVALKIADALDVKLEIVKLSWEGLIPALESGKIDMIIAGMSPTAERDEEIDFSNKYYTSELCMVVLKDGDYASATKISDFSGAKITGQKSTFHYSVIDQIEGVKKQTAMDTFPAMISSLQSGKIDGYVSELPGAVSAAQSNTDLTYIQFAEGNGFTASEEDVAIAVGVRDGSNLVDSINKALDKITDQDRKDLMDWAIKNQPVTQG